MGNIVSSWKRKGNSIIYQVSIPANTTASIHFPKVDGKTIWENWKLISEVNGGNALKLYKVQAGEYRFEIR